MISEVLERYRSKIRGMIHCSGGGQTKVLHFIRDMHIVKNDLFEIPPLFRMIQEQSGTSWKEMYEVFNMGHRMELYVPETLAQKIIDIAQSYKVDAKVIGYCERCDANLLTIKTKEGIFQY